MERIVTLREQVHVDPHLGKVVTYYEESTSNRDNTMPTSRPYTTASKWPNAPIPPYASPMRLDIRRAAVFLT
eukprot:scaffold3342_cov174-Amphora_coffeaeformis.AAC.15